MSDLLCSISLYLSHKLVDDYFSKMLAVFAPEAMYFSFDPDQFSVFERHVTRHLNGDFFVAGKQDCFLRLGPSAARNDQLTVVLYDFGFEVHCEGLFRYEQE
ncbi:MAG: hypothetical protein QNJ40_17435 [Xanthomonadales bacterium]|nr:hypothetical protein [Xanthomonadales bacterium]